MTDADLLLEAASAIRRDGFKQDARGQTFMHAVKPTCWPRGQTGPRRAQRSH